MTNKLSNKFKLKAAAILLCMILNPTPKAKGQTINSWHSGSPAAYFTTGSPNHLNFSLIFGVPKYEAPHGLNFDSPEAVTKFPCSLCWIIGQNKHGELWFAIWKNPCFTTGGQCSYVGRFENDAIIEDDEITGESLTIKRFHGTLLGTLYLNGTNCKGVQAFFTNKTNATKIGTTSGGLGDLDVRIWTGECQ